MDSPIRLISTDFDGTLHADFEEPPVAAVAEQVIGELQSKGVKWVINTGRELPSLLEGLHQARLSIWPDYVVTVEREIHARRNSKYVGWEDWNSRCGLDHMRIFECIQSDIPKLADWINSRFKANVYADAYSPLCLIAESTRDAGLIHDYLNDYCRGVPNLTVVRNHIYARLSHAEYNKGTALAEIGRRLGIKSAQTVAIGDHLNDMPMLSTHFARWLVAPSNAVEEVKDLVRRQKGYVSDEPHGYGVARGLRFILASFGGD